MAYREPSAPPRATTRLEYGPYPLDWRPLLVAALPLGGAAMFVYGTAAPEMAPVYRLFAALCGVGLLWVTLHVIRLSLGATRRLSIVIEGEGDELELELRERRQLGQRTRRVSLRGIQGVERAWLGKQGQIVLHLDDDRRVPLLRGVDDRLLRAVAKDLRRELLPDAAGERGPGDGAPGDAGLHHAP